MQHEIPDDAAFLLPWTRITNPIEADRLVAEFLLEAPYLKDALPIAVAHRSDNDDVLFQFQETREVRQGGFSFGVVHLSWSGVEEPKIDQQIEFFECWSHWEAAGMRRDVEEGVSRRETDDA
ncbi:MAG: hypothetical protein JWN40_5053 [Phycisphaerales bacterium]|nr:hypothetical protein [Phycisphaerales bacterium]